MSNSSHYIPFSQRNGISPVPPQLQLGEVSEEFRRLIIYALQKEIRRCTGHNYAGVYFVRNWGDVASDLQVKFFKIDPDSANLGPDDFYKKLKQVLMKVEYAGLFDIVEFFYRHPNCNSEFKVALVSAFEEARLAYRLLPSGVVIAVGNEEQANAVLMSFQLTEECSAEGARRHLHNSGLALRNGDWAGSVRESIHAVEAVAKMFAPSSKTLGDALSVLERQHDLHSALKVAFGNLYGYTNDEKGLRHALVLKDHSNVGEAEALFMLGACASFVSYLLTKMASEE